MDATRPPLSALDLADHSFDIVGSQFGVMLFPGMPRGISEMARVAKPGGRVLLSTHGAYVYHPNPVDRWRWTHDGLGRWRDHSWWPPVVIAALAVALLLFLCWVALEVRAGRLRVLPLGRDGVTLAGPALAAAMAGRVQAVDGVARAHVRLLGRPHRLRARITLVLAADGSPRAVLRRLAEQAVAEARAAAAPRALEAEVRIGVRTHRARPRRRVR